MALVTKALPGGREISCINPYEVDFSVHEIFSADLAAHGIALPHDGLFLDVGANIGLFSLRLREKCPAARILAYEPMPDVLRALAENMGRLAPAGEAYALALGAEPGTATFDYFPGLTAMSSSHPDVAEKMADGIRAIMAGASGSAEVRDLVESTGADERATDGAYMEDLFRRQRVTVDVDTVSRQLTRHGIERVDLLKVDTEGAELDVLAGIAEADWPKISQLMVEVHLGDEVLNDLAADFEARGYAISIDRHPLADGGAAVSQIYAVRRGDKP
ncbi:FkbM family methyltransferase [Rhodobium orientis]|uniref:FkbM family methyltransferase n=1 Tax=Rhodobium orientis TaxID=34017 RepID=UPI001475C8A0|nr:FkbM family methyltransferase [Rhodobium orientis]MBB4302673.1 FkbM family methyltransferase [Rhodobium orientis]